MANTLPLYLRLCQLRSSYHLSAAVIAQIILFVVLIWVIHH